MVSTQRSPNGLSLGDTVLFSVYGWSGPAEYTHPILCRIKGFRPSGTVELVAVDVSDDPDVRNEWVERFANLRRGAWPAEG